MGNGFDFGQGEGTLSQGANHVNDTQKKLQGLCKKLDGQINEVRSGWGGAGADAFQLLHQAWMEKQTTITNELQRFEDSLRGTEKTNTTTDEDNKSNLAAIHQAVGGASTGM